LVVICCYTQCEYSEAIAVGTATTRINNPIISQLSLYIEPDNATGRKAVVNGTTTITATQVSFSGNGTVRDVNYSDSGKALIRPRDNGATNVRGYITMITSSGDMASVLFKK
jgi:hypothetical protein